ncbi:MAG: sugar phosphate nucleotidyltransferase [Chthoniobacterales bacterium]
MSTASRLWPLGREPFLSVQETICFRSPNIPSGAERNDALILLAAIKSHFAIPGLYVYDNRVVEFCQNLKPSARGELEIIDLNLAYLQRNELHVKPLGRGMAWLDTGTQTSLLEAGNYIATIEHRQGLKIACLEEVAFRMNFISESELQRIVDGLPKGEYQDYLRLVCAEGPAAYPSEPVG